MQNCFLHVDLDAFFASVEQLDHPELRGKPVIVGGTSLDRRGVVSTASYEARRFGVHSAMPLFQAKQRCPQGIFLPVRMERYHEKSAEVMAIFSQYSPDVHQISVDEAFIDLTGTERLFGSPEETARRLKREVKEKTGLTVSVGMASTKYVAKIASGISKPDGFFVVSNGKESEFILSLPLEKLWGVGEKTLQRLRYYNIKTTHDIFIRSKPILENIFGKAGGNFLYNAVRGNEQENFNLEAKSHSISAENTYSYDLTDSYSIETALFELCYTVMFRSHREKLVSQTVCVKIRYDDFSTVTVQGTEERDVSSMDDLFRRVKKLFEKKYKKGTGIRLLGVAMQNVVSSENTRQQELFDFGEEKKRKVEQAIQKLKEKDPSIKITKARLLDKNKLFSILAAILLFSAGAKTHAENSKKSTEKDSDGAGSIVFDTSKLPVSTDGEIKSIFSYDFNDVNVEFLAEGYWKASVIGACSYSFGFGNAATFSKSTPVIEQNVDLSLWFLVNKHWYFEAAFADEFETNTVAAGYFGDGTVKSARIGNRGIKFPSTYSIDDINRGVGGGENQAPGVSINLGGSRWQADAVVRFDMLKAEEKTWYGKNSVSTDNIDLAAWNTGNQYVLPSSQSVTAVTGVYVESISGDYRDEQGRKYNKLDESQYLLLPVSNMVVLSKDAKAAKSDGTFPAVAFVFSASYRSTLESELGYYGSQKNPGTGFLGAVQEWFSSVNVSPYSYGKLKGSARGGDSLGTATDGFFGTIETETVLYVQHPAGFSPFLAAYRYDIGISTATDAAIASKTTEISSNLYEAVITDDDLAFTTTDFFHKSHTYTDVYVTTAEKNLKNPPSVRFPLAKLNPGIYLGYSSEEDMVLRVRTYTPVSRYEIGTDAVPGTVRVYKNGVIDSGATYNSDSGTITLSVAAGVSDHIFATWYEESADNDTGSFTGAAGFKYDFTDTLSGDVSAAGRWTYAKSQKYADADFSSPGYFTLATNVTQKTENFLLSNTAAASLEIENTLENYRILGMDDSDSETHYLTKDSGYNLPSNFIPIISDNIELESENNGSKEISSGLSDIGISGYAVPIAWDFSNIEGTADSPAWASYSINIAGTSGTLSTASLFSIALRNASADVADFDVYLQLGVDADEKFSYEDSLSIPTWKISKDTANPDNNKGVRNCFFTDNTGWQTVTVNLSDIDRSRLTSHYGARIIITSTAKSESLILAGPYGTNGQSFSITAPENAVVTTFQQPDVTLASSKIKKFNSGINTVQHFDWSFDDSTLETTSDESLSMQFHKYFDEIDTTSYKELSFWFNYEPEAPTEARGAYMAEIPTYSLSFTFDRPENGISKKCAEISLKREYLSNLARGWHSITIDLEEESLKIDDYSVSSLYTSIYIDRSIIPVRFGINLNPVFESSNKIFFYKTGSFSIDEIYLSETDPSIIFQDKLKSSWKKDGEVLSVLGKTIVSDIAISGTGNGSTTLKTGDKTYTDKILSGNGRISGTVTNLKIALESAKDSDTDGIISASHSVQTDKPFFDILAFSESYTFFQEDKSLEKGNKVSMDLKRLSIPLKMNADFSSTSDSWSKTQTAAADGSSKIGIFTLTAKGSASQKISTTRHETDVIKTDEYFDSWKKITNFEFSSGSKDASKRQISGETKAQAAFNSLAFKPSVAFATQGMYKSSAYDFFTDSSSVTFTFPFTVNKNNFSFSWKKTTGGISYTEKGGNYSSDAELLGKKLNDEPWIYTSLPVHDLTSKRLAKKILEKSSSDKTSLNKETESLYYTTSYSANWKRAFSGTKYDFFIPTSTTTTFSRDIRTAASVSDLYQIKQTVNFSAINIFGKTGLVPVFSWYEQDEYTTSLSIAYKIPKASPSEYTLAVGGYTQATFLINERDSLKSGLSANYEGNNDWTGKFTLVWKRKGITSPLLVPVRLFKTKEDINKLVLTRTDSINASASSASSTTKITRKYAFEYSHEVEIQLTKYLSINSGLGTSYNATWDKLVTLTGTASIGCTVKF